jgi:hypothetical protein
MVAFNKGWLLDCTVLQEPVDFAAAASECTTHPLAYSLSFSPL